MFGVKYKCDSGSRSSRSGGVMGSYVILLVFCTCGVVTSLQVKHFFVPDIFELNSPETIKLECDVGFNQNERQQIVIQWFLNDTTLLYQWTENRTSGLPYINLNFLDPRTSNRISIQNWTIKAPIEISNKTINHTGIYRCLATINVIQEEFEQTMMQMYVPVDNITLDQVFDNNTNKLNVTCGTEDVYPKPEIKLFINGQENMTSESTLDVRINQNQLFDISATYTVPVDDFQSTIKINCSVILPDVKIMNSRSTQYNKSGYVGDDIDIDANATTISAQDSIAPGSSTLNLINSYLISTSVLAVFMLARRLI